MQSLGEEEAMEIGELNRRKREIMVFSVKISVYLTRTYEI